MEKTKKIINDRLDFLNDWLEKTKDFTDESTVANRMSVNETLVYFIRVKELLDLLGQNPTYEVAKEIKELVSLTIDKLISHNEKTLSGLSKLVESLTTKINTNPESSEKEKEAISHLEQAFSSIKQYLDDCIEAKNEITAAIEKIEAENPAPVKYDTEELEQSIEEHIRESSGENLSQDSTTEDSTTEDTYEEIVEHIVDDVDGRQDVELLEDDKPKKEIDDAEFPI